MGNSIVVHINLQEIEYNKISAKKTLRKLRAARKKADIFKKNLIVNSKFDLSEDLHKIKNEYEYDIKTAIKAVQIEDKIKRIDFLYDEICYYLDHVCIPENLCEFKNDQCFAKKGTDVLMGCCHHYPNKKLGMFYQKKMVPCEYLGKKGCTTKAIGCKLFMCDEVNKKGYKFNVYNVLLIRYFFNFIQKIIIMTGIFTTKEKIMNRLLKCNY